MKSRNNKEIIEIEDIFEQVGYSIKELEKNKFKRKNKWIIGFTIYLFYN